jgi:hypothetical protein
VKERKSAVLGAFAEQSLSTPPFTRVLQTDALDPLPEADEYENDDFTALYDSSKRFVDSYKQGGAPKFFGESSAFTFSQLLGKDGLPTGTRRPEFWTTPNVSSSC